jgi:hypothetical protein
MQSEATCAADASQAGRKITVTVVVASGTYIGEMLENSSKRLRHGYGVMKYSNGNLFMGEWKDDCFDGFGEYIWSDGRKFKGSFKNDKMDGKGEVVWPDGRRFEGEYRMDLAHGHGLVVLADGRTFEGEFKDGFPTAGQMIEANGDAFRAKFDGASHVSEWKPQSKVWVGVFEEGWKNSNSEHPVREFAWCDGRRFAGSCKRYCPLAGVFTDNDGNQYTVSYGGNSMFSEDPIPVTKKQLKTKAIDPLFSISLRDVAF